jgi:hypothetical protein
MNLRQAAEQALAYIEQALAQHDQQYQRHPSTERDRQVIVNDLEALRQALAQPEQEPVDKNGSPCSEFWDWLPKAYNFDDDGSFTKYNMEVAFLAGKQSIAQQPPIAFMGTDFGGNPTKFRLNPFSGSFPLYAAPPKKEWVGLTADEIWKCNKAEPGSAVDFHICVAHQNVLDFAEAIEAKLKEKNGG